MHVGHNLHIVINVFASAESVDQCLGCELAIGNACMFFMEACMNDFLRVEGLQEASLYYSGCLYVAGYSLSMSL